MLPRIRDAIYLFVLLVASPYLVFRSLRTGRYRKGWTTKLMGLGTVPTQSCNSKADVVWLHGVSVGEVQLLAPVIQKMRERKANLQFAVSVTTQTGMDVAKGLFTNDADVTLFYFPLDFSWAIRRTLKTLNPAMLVLAELEVWPNLIDIAKSQSVTVAVINGRLGARSYKGYLRWGILFSRCFRQLDLVAAQSVVIGERFKQCGTNTNCIRITGSIKFDNVSFDRHSPSVERFRKLAGLAETDIVWIAGSTQPGEELAVSQAFYRARQVGHRNLKLIVVPRHAERFDSVANELTDFGTRVGLRAMRRSELPSEVAFDNKPWDMLVIDSLGELKWWWGLADLALVGGSFGKRGGQNMLEPAAYGAEVAFGPQTRNFRDIVERLLERDAAVQLSDLSAIEPWLLEQIDGGINRGPIAQQVVSEHQGALDRTVNELIRLLHDQEVMRLNSLPVEQRSKAA